RGGDEGPADLTAELAADRDVLQVRVAARQAAGRGADLAEGRVDAAVPRAHQRRQRVQGRRLQLRQLAVTQDRLDYRVLVAELLQHVGVGRERALGRPLARRETQLLVQDHAQLGR